MNKLPSYLKRVDIKKYGTVAAAIVIVVVIIITVTILTRPKRSVAAYCKVYRQEKVQLGSAGDNNYEFSTSVFPGAASNDAGYFVPAFNKLADVAPKEIEPQVVAMRDIFKRMQSDPAQTLSLALNGLPAESTVTQWTQQHCGD